MEENIYRKKVEEIENQYNWEDELTRTSKGVIEATIENYKLFLNNSKKFKGKIKYNEYLRQCEFDGEIWGQFVHDYVYQEIERYFYYVKKSTADTAINNVLNEHRYNPVADYINALKWDGEKRIETLFINLLEADDTKLNREMTKKWMIAAIKRTLNPGCKFDNMLILQGGQGIGKSTICERLARGYFSTISVDEFGDKDLIDKMNKTWIGIVDEMDNFSKKEMSSIKTFLSQTDDTARLAYERTALTYQRHCVFIGSTNDDTFLRDLTSTVERRFWIIKCNKTTRDKKVSDVLTNDYVDQLWAEALYYYNQDKNQYLDIDQDLMSNFEKEQAQYKLSNDDPFIDLLYDVLDKEYTIGVEGEVIDAAELSYDSGKAKSKINKIKIATLAKYMADNYSNMTTYRGTALKKYIKNTLMISGQWKEQTVKFKKKNNSVEFALKRVDCETKNNKKISFDPMDICNEIGSAVSDIK